MITTQTAAELDMSELAWTRNAQLRSALRDAMSRLAEPLAEDETIADRIIEITTGSDVEPGVYNEDPNEDPDSGRWIAWDYDPTGVDPDDFIIVRQTDLPPIR